MTADFDKKMLLWLAVIVVVDLFVLIPGADSVSNDPSIAIGLIFYIPGLVIVNIVIGLLSLVFKRKWALPIFLNAIIAPIIFYNAYTYTAQRHRDSRLKTYYFESGHKHYMLDIDLDNGKFTDSLEFEFYGLGKSSSWSIGLSGHYTVNHDTLILPSDSLQLKVLGLELYGFPGAAGRVKMTEEMPELR